MARPAEAVGARGDARGAIAALRAILGRQREALVRGDLMQLQASTEELLLALSNLQAAGPLRSSSEVRALAAARSALHVNTDLLHRAGGAIARALSTLFDAPSTYGPSGSGPVRRASRPLDAA